jgi:hypothetical protein
MRPLLVSLGLALAAAGAHAQTAGALNCRSQVNFTCGESCEAEPGPADLALDFTAGTGDYCRGSRCDSGTLTASDETGQWNGDAYRVFSLKGGEGDSAFSVSGAVDVGTGTFFAVTSDIPHLFGRCE